jgi:thiamine-monophosphate kinase
MMNEFDLIQRYFLRTGREALRASLIDLAIGDDCALLSPRANAQLAVSSDMLLEGRHFLSTVDAAALGHKALAVNLSDLAACGATPLAFALALAMPQINEPWLAAFSRGLFALADLHNCELIGGDTTRGPLNICITVIGEIPMARGASQALLRSGAKAGDDVYVSGTLGDARLALEVFRGSVSVSADVFAQARLRMEQPTPRVALGQALRGVATSAIDVSDGLLGDLGHVLKASKVGATIQTDVASHLMAAYMRASSDSDSFAHEFPKETRLAYVLAGGDDYELAFTAAPEQRSAVQNAAQISRTHVTRIGRIDEEPGLRLVDGQGKAVANTFPSFDHFSSP